MSIHALALFKSSLANRLAMERKLVPTLFMLLNFFLYINTSHVVIDRYIYAVLKTNVQLPTSDK